MKAIVSFGSYHFLLPVEVAIKFGEHAKEVDRNYEGEAGYVFREMKSDRTHQVEVAFVDENSIKPAKEEP